MRNRFGKKQINTVGRGIRARLRDGSCLSTGRHPRYGISLIMTCPYCGSLVTWTGKEWHCRSCSWRGQNAKRSLE